MDEDRGLRHKVIVISGGCGDIGSATTEKLAARGARVIVFDLLKKSDGAKQARRIGAADYLRVDQGSQTQVERGIAKVVERFERVDTVIANAAVGPPGDLLERTADDWKACLRVNLIGCAALARAAVVPMLEQAPDPDGIRGKLLFTSSWVGSHPRPGAIDYCVSKAGLDHLVRLIAQEFAARGIRANAVAPGILDAGLTRKAFQRQPELREKFQVEIPVGEFGTPEQVADAFVFLCSHESNYITGHTLLVDGGCALTRARP